MQPEITDKKAIDKSAKSSEVTRLCLPVLSNQNAGGEPPTEFANFGLLSRYERVRERTEALALKLSAEDMTVQSMPDASPTKWHLGHTTWFFEAFLLIPYKAGYKIFDPSFGYLFNSYYEALGARYPRSQRGLITRPSVDEIFDYRHHVNKQMYELLKSGVNEPLTTLLNVGIAHEEQHQELLLMDILHLFAQSPTVPAFDSHLFLADASGSAQFHRIEGGLIKVGAVGQDFFFDNEGPRHSVWLEPYEIGDRLVTNEEWLAFMGAGGYERPELWLSDGWTTLQSEGWRAPLYWQQANGRWHQMTLSHGLAPLNLGQAVTHISYYEAAAFAHWRGARLPTEAEWEHAVHQGVMHQIDDVAWQWTQSPYLPYPGFKAARGAVGEYNGKFMLNQMVLRGGTSITPKGHTRPTYRNFYRPEQRWQFSGVRLARDVPAEQYLVPANSNEFLGDVLDGLASKPKVLSPKYFYDATGSSLFEEICRAEEYYPTRTESALLRQIVQEISADIPSDSVLVELGSGASDKTRILLDAAPQISTYIPIDISDHALRRAAEGLSRDYPLLVITPVLSDFTQRFSLPSSTLERHLVGFFPGSTIGNFSREEASRLLTHVHAELGDRSQLIIGVDLVKDEQTLVKAYNDREGVTAQFNKNLLERINRELAGTFDVTQFDHKAIWNADRQRIEMHLISRMAQIVRVAGSVFYFESGESIHTENSHKYTCDSFRDLAQGAGWIVHRQWISQHPEFAIFVLRDG